MILMKVTQPVDIKLCKNQGDWFFLGKTKSR